MSHYLNMEPPARTYRLVERQPVSLAVWRQLMSAGQYGNWARRTLRSQQVRLAGPGVAHLRPRHCSGSWTVTRMLHDLTEVSYRVREPHGADMFLERTEAYLEGRCQVRGEWVVARARVELTIMERIIGGRIWEALPEAEVALACLG